LSEEEQIDGLKKVGVHAVLGDTRKRVIDTLATYGEKAIPAIIEVVDGSVFPDVKEYGLGTVKKLKRK